MCSETALPIDATVQVNAAIWSGNSVPGRQMGVQLVLVFPDVVRTSARLQFHLGEQQWYVDDIISLIEYD